LSGDPLLGVTRDGDKGLKVIQTERGPITPRAGLILDRPFSLLFCQIVALMLPHRSWFAGLFVAAMRRANAQFMEETLARIIHEGSSLNHQKVRFWLRVSSSRLSETIL
jgi:hypothetical protein